MANDRDGALARVAPELRAALEVFPQLDFSNRLDAFRTGMSAVERPPLPPELRR